MVAVLGQFGSTCSFSLASSLLVSRKLAAIFASTRQSRSMLVRHSLPLQAKLSYLIRRHRLTLVFCKNQILSRPGRGVRVGLASFYRQGFFHRAGTGLIRIDSGNNGVLACREVSIVILARSKGCHVLAVDGQDKDKTAPKICLTVND